MRLALVLALWALLGSARATVYSWTDSKGVWHSGTTPPPKGAKLKGKVKTLKTAKPAMVVTVDPNAPSPSPSPAPGQTKPAPVVELYTTSWCGYCKKTRAYFESRGIPYHDYDIENDASADARYRALGGRGVPVVVINGTPTYGYSEEAFAQLLAR